LAAFERAALIDNVNIIWLAMKLAPLWLLRALDVENWLCITFSMRTSFAEHVYVVWLTVIFAPLGLF